ncbi:anhydro-N-acetylmuramic acid kinase [Shewanella intestini]|uniref:Anhydro-N-acetylmuramic acid kinase n=1 Tax=Shewanella intestini TaxID=2017544 RepID=A0ABS5HZZ9_9GAMM|nr:MULTISPECIES: anhydro-N-acetylmuramic acid kinase [Shewanella]MBR9726620.1 anhydro-N-acetylmuramic acid kinase [Shewanella intestini]MRG34814.1 anhydro-N-acetylmuramic acid kinase [Shewanella sp. XMDDZSB0408]
MKPDYYIGLMSGTSMDGVDAVLVNFASGSPVFECAYTEPIPAHILSGLQRLCAPSNNEINPLGQLDRHVGKLFARAVNQLLIKAKLTPEQITAIGSHGQTVRHMPDLDPSFTLQIGDPNTIAAETGINVIADFRSKDIALGGQGAPLVPAFHQQVFTKPDIDRVILNIGGIANITYLSANAEQVIGFDTGPGNTLMDTFIQQERQQAYDNNGQWAASGTVNKALLSQLLSHSYFAMSYPKSTGRELFNRKWLAQQLANFTAIAPEDIQATLLDFTCYSIANDIRRLTTNGEILVCGGGARNSTLMARLAEILAHHTLTTTASAGIDPQWVEGIAFAWLAMRFVHRLPGNLPAVTGASRAAILGGLFVAD